MQTGTIKWFDAAKGFGFIVPQDGGNDVYVGAKVLQKANLEALEPGSVVTFSLSGKGDRVYAANVAFVSAPLASEEAAPVVTASSVMDSNFDAEEDFEREWGLRRA